MIELRGTVLDADGEPLDDFHLTVFRRNSDSEVFRFRRATGVLEAQTDTSAYAVAIDAAGHARWFGGFGFRSGGSHDFGNVRLASERVLTGRVLESATAVPIAGAAIEYIPPATIYNSSLNDLAHEAGSSTVTDGDGRFTLDGLPPEALRLAVRAAGYAAREVHLPSGARQQDIELGLGGTIEGTVTLPTGEPVEGAVRLVPQDRWRTLLKPPPERRLDSLGSFRYRLVRSGSYSVVVRTDAGTVETRTIAVTEGDQIVIDLPVDPLGRLSGAVAGLSETMSVQIRVRSADADTRFWRNASEEVGNGPFELNGIPDGAYVVEADAGAFSLERKVDMVNGVATVHFEFNDGSSLSGRVLAGNRPLPHLHVDIIPTLPELPHAGVSADSEGRFEVGPLPNGDYRVRVRLGLRGTYRAFDVTVTGDTTFDVRLGPHRLSGKMLGDVIEFGPSLRGSSMWVNHPVQASLLDAKDEPVVFRDFVDSRGMFSFDGLEEGRYAVSHGIPYWGEGGREVSVFGGWVEGVDFRPAHSDTQPVRWLDADSRQTLGEATCSIHDGRWAGLIQTVEEYGLPTPLAGADMTCSKQGYKPVRFRWDGEPIAVEFERAAN